MKPAKAIILFLAVTAPLHIARAQASFDAGEGCLNVVEVSYAQGIGEYGDGGISETTCTKSSLTSDLA